MSTSAIKINLFLFFKLPSAFWCGVRLKSIDAINCHTTVKHRWINQNPFNSMYFAVQSMAAELATGALVMQEIKRSNLKISMLVSNNKSNFTKKATGTIIFVCNDGEAISKTIQHAIATKEPQVLWMKSIGTNEKNEQVSEFDFEWSIKVK